MASSSSQGEGTDRTEEQPRSDGTTELFEEEEEHENPFFGENGRGSELCNISTVIKRPSYLNFGGSTGLLPSTQPFNVSVIKRLDSLLEDSIADVLEEEKLKTYLRIRSSSSLTGGKGSVPKKGEAKVLEIKDDTTVIAYPVQKSNASVLVGGRPKQTEFKFSKVLGPDSGQSDVFDECISPLIDKFLRNDNCLVFTYGATNSGKTYTLQGHGQEYGIIPRTLDALFNRIGDRLYKEDDLKPLLYQFSRHQYPQERLNNRIQKEKILMEAAMIPKRELLRNISPRDSCEGSQNSSSIGSAVNLVGGGQFHEMNYALFANTTLLSVWVSYAELYNERIYDLLETVHTEKNKRRKECKLMQDGNGFVYVKDLTEIHVTSDDEAFKIFLAGRKNLQFAATQMNQKSSRSHSFFTLRIITIGIGEGLMPFPTSVHRLTFCDLAGMERAQQTENEGLRLRESSNINISLTTLLKVIRILREKQLHKNNMIETIPFRESKLTHIFKSYFTSSTHICMIVNVNPDPAMANSTLQVLHNSAIASNVIVFRPIENKPLVDIKQKQVKAKSMTSKCESAKKQVGFALHKNEYVNTKDPFQSSSEEDEKERPGSQSSESEDEVPSIVFRNRLLHQRLAELERENLYLRAKLEQSEREKNALREQSVKFIAEQNRLWSKRFDEARIQEEFLSQRRVSLMRHQLALSPGSKCARQTPPVLDMENIQEESEEEPCN